MYARDKQANFRVINSNIGPLKRLRHSADYEDKRFLYNDSLHAIELVKNMYRLTYQLPITGRTGETVLKMDREQEELVELIREWVRK